MIKKSKSLLNAMVIAFALSLTTSNIHSMNRMFHFSSSPAPTARPVSGKEALFAFIGLVCIAGYPLICDAIKFCKKAIR